MIADPTLNPPQSRAVNWDRGPALIAGGPGSGKTLVLGLRLARILEEAKGDRALVLTLARESATRIARGLETLAPSARGRAEISALDDFAVFLARQHADRIGINPGFEILADDVERLALLGEIRRSLKASGVESPLGAETLLRMLRLLAESELGQAPGATPFDLELAGRFTLFDICNAYNAKMRQYNRYDVYRIDRLAKELLEKFTHIATDLQRKFHYIFVDDLHLANLSQYSLLLKVIGPKRRELIVTADPLRLGGRRPSAIERFALKFEAAVIRLPGRPDVPEPVLSAASRLDLADLQDESRETSPAVTVIGFDSFDEEAAYLVEEMGRLTPLARSGTAILAPSRELLRRAAAALEREGIQCRLSESASRFDSHALRALEAVLILGVRERDEGAFEILAEAFRELESLSTDAGGVVFRALASNRGFLPVWLEGLDLSEPASAFLREAAARPEGLDPERLDPERLLAALAAWVEGRGLEPLALAWFRAELAILRESLAGLEDSGPVTSERLLAALAEPAPPDTPASAPILLNLGDFKGGVFQRVHVLGLVEGLPPAGEGGSSRDIRERERLFAALTMAGESATLTFSRSLAGVATCPSRFLIEMDLASAQETT